MNTLVFAVVLTMTAVQAIPIMNKETEKNNNQLELIYVQTSVLEDIFYDLVCAIVNCCAIFSIN